MAEMAPVEVTVVGMTYDSETNVFYMKVEQVSSKKQIEFAMRALDFGITPEVDRKIIDDFCEQMSGKIKTLNIEVDRTSLGRVRKEREEDGPLSQEEIDQVYDSVSDFPIPEVSFRIMKEIQGEG
jgi:hypothetical protein